MKMLKTIDLNKIYGEEENEVHALKEINIKIEPHKFTSIIGPSGSGKSTFYIVLPALIGQHQGKSI